MPQKNKLPFWQLLAVFSMITLLALGVAFGYGVESHTGMMSGSMGGMMRSMHAHNATIRDLLTQHENMDVQKPSDTGSHASHHSGSSELKTANFATTAIIIALLPLILAGTVFLAVLWFGKSDKGGVKK